MSQYSTYMHASLCLDSLQTPWTIAHQPPLSLGFGGQDYRSVLPFPLTGDLPDPGSEPSSPVFSALAGRFFSIAPAGNPL